MKVSSPQVTHRALRDSLISAMMAHAEALAPYEILAVVSHLVGQLVALQDQRSISPSLAMEIVALNIEQGNRDAISGLLTPEGSA